MERNDGHPDTRVCCKKEGARVPGRSIGVAWRVGQGPASKP